MTPIPPRTQRRYSRWAQLHAILSAGHQGLADGLLHPTLILSAIAFMLGGTPYQIAAFSVISAACWAFGTSLVRSLIFVAKSPIPIVAAGLILRLGSILLFAFVGLRLDDISPNNALDTLLVCYVPFQIGSVIVSLASSGPIASAYVASRRAAMFQSRAVITATTAFGAAVVTERLFASNAISVTTSIRDLLYLAAIATLASGWFLIQIPRRNRRDFTTVSVPAADGIRGSLRSSAIRRFLAFRFILGIATLADPFIIVYGMQELGFTLRLAGMALVAFTLMQLIGTVCWGRWLAEHSALRILQSASFLRVVTLVLALAIPTLAGSSVYTDRFDSSTVAGWTFAGAIGLLGLGGSIHNVANQRYLVQLTDGTSPQASIALANLLLGCLAFAPLGGAFLIERYSYETTIASGAAIAFVAFLASASLAESRPRVSTRLGMWGLTNRRRARNAA